MIAAGEEATPQCVHFGVCGGCQYQNLAYTAQLALKRARVEALLAAVEVNLPKPVVHAAEPYGYRNRIRLRVEHAEGVIRCGYNVQGGATFLPIVMCPIAAPPLWNAAQALMVVAAEDKDARAWFGEATEMELFVDDALSKIQMTLLCPPRTRFAQGSFARMMRAVTARIPQIAGAGAVALDAKVGLTGKVLETWGAPGMQYRVGKTSYWVSRGGFFQINRFLLATMVEIVTHGRRGGLAWDLYAGVGLFSRALARTFAQVIAVEAGPVAAKDLRAALATSGPQHRAVEATAVAFLERAAMERERPELIVLDPPRAGADARVCTLMTQIAPREIVYVSCDPATLARDAKTIAENGYRVSELQILDLFPQTAHVETVMVFQRAS